MPQETPFLTEPSAAGETATGPAPDALFDLAVNRAALAVRGSTLEAWHARTRFARRVNLSDIRRALASRPQGENWHWQGGNDGSWMPGKAQFP
ncbi:hypothetical protein ACFOPQ_20175 [Deinococcus antarcticus]|uniref:Uncharacterized protein n=1 Tax=Deinococcus antarcticus TaxID=1298767 RepID=A0ABV8AF15_9DEIO